MRPGKYQLTTLGLLSQFNSPSEIDLQHSWIQGQVYFRRANCQADFHIGGWLQSLKRSWL